MKDIKERIIDAFNSKYFDEAEAELLAVLKDPPEIWGPKPFEARLEQIRRYRDAIPTIISKVDGIEELDEIRNALYKEKNEGKIDIFTEANKLYNAKVDHWEAYMLLSPVWYEDPWYIERNLQWLYNKYGR